MFSLGIFTKLKHYQAPNSSFWYAGILPFISWWKFYQAHRSTDSDHFVNNFKGWFKMLQTGFIHHIAITGVVCARLGHHRVSLREFPYAIKYKVSIEDNMLDILYQEKRRNHMERRMIK